MSDLKFWTGAGVVTGSKLFIRDKDGNPVDVTDQPHYADVSAYLPKNPKDEDGDGQVDPIPLYLVGRVSTTNKKGDPIVKLFANATWEVKLLDAFEYLEFSIDPKYPVPEEHLLSHDDAGISAGNWVSEGPMELFWHLPGPAKPTAKVTFKNGNESVSAFWCWAE